MICPLCESQVDPKNTTETPDGPVCDGCALIILAALDAEYEDVILYAPS